MAKIIYKEGCEGENKLSSIEGIEIDLFNGQKALIYPKYAQKRMLDLEQMRKWGAETEVEIEALKVTDTAFATECLCEIGSPAALWVSQFKYAKYSNFALPSLLAALEIQLHKAEIDALAETIEGADLLRNFTSYTWSCSKCYSLNGWYAYGYAVCSRNNLLSTSYLAVPTLLY